MDEIKQKFINEAEDLFMRYGFKSITMDDIARELGVSKKTLYQYFTDKNDLVNQVVESHLNTEIAFCDEVAQTQKDPIAYLLAISDNFGKESKQINPAVLFDLRKYFKEAWDKIHQYSQEFIYNQILNNLIVGKEKGLYRAELNEKIIAQYYVNMMQFMVNPENYSKDERNINSVYNELLRYHLHGILTDKGLKQLEKLEIQNN